jgi:3-oxoacyl-[acyl-carrier protein] reductase
MEAVYSAMKGAQVAFAKSYAKEVATLGITVNVVSPGAVNTRMNLSWTSDELAEVRKKIPLERFAEPSEVATVVDFLLSDRANYITGSVIPVNGGWGL